MALSALFLHVLLPTLSTVQSAIPHQDVLVNVFCSRINVSCLPSRVNSVRHVVIVVKLTSDLSIVSYGGARVGQPQSKGIQHVVASALIRPPWGRSSKAIEGSERKGKNKGCSLALISKWISLYAGLRHLLVRPTMI